VTSQASSVLRNLFGAVCSFVWRQAYTHIRFMSNVLASRCHLWSAHHYNSLNTTSSSPSIGTTTLSWVSACSTVEHSQQEGFTECRCQWNVKPPTWRRSLNTTSRLLISPAICVLVCGHLHFTAVNCIFVVLCVALVSPLFEPVQWLQKIQTCVNKVTPGKTKHVTLMFP
jgi:hypothetical protein